MAKLPALEVQTSIIWMTLTFDFASAMSHSSKLKALKAADFGCFGATWWPRASYERLKITTFLSAWVSDLLRHFVR